MRATAAERLLKHYDEHKRDLPWRQPEPDAYRVWLSEVMLQQTTVAAVIPRFVRFLERWPTVEALAAASDSDVLHEWAGLGYYARARNLIACARAVAAQGGFPETEAELRKLPGVGDYTAAAIAAIAFGGRAVVVDTNVKRVIARLTTGGDVRSAYEAIMPIDRPGDFAQALMDLGATICRPRDPDCGRCPLRADCLAFKTGRVAEFPIKAVCKARPQRYGAAHWTERNDCVWLVRRPPKGMLGGMAALPGPDWQSEPVAAQAIARIDHVFTHFALELAVVAKAEPKGEGWWQPLDRLSEAGLPTLYLKAARAVRDARRALAA